MQGPATPTTEDNEAYIPTELVRNGPDLNRTTTVRRKAAKRTFPWDLTAAVLHHASNRAAEVRLRPRSCH